jgi:RNA polymerase sigma-70 factor (ECF subfamily)
MRFIQNDYAKDQEKLIVDLNNGVIPAFQFIFHQYYRSLVYFVLKLSINNQQAEDLVQNTFIKLWERRENFDSITTLKSFLYLTARNSCIDQKRHARVVDVFSKDKIIESDFDFENPFEYELIESDIIRLVNDAIENLPKRCREVISLSLKGFKNSEIADELGVTLNTVKTQRQRAMNLIRQKVGKEMLMLLLLFSDQFFQ